MNGAAWPERRAVCIDCRTAYEPGTAACAASPKHRVRDLSDREQREDLVTEVWGLPSARRRARQLAQAGGGGAAGGLGVESCSACEVAEGCAGAGDLSPEIAGILMVVVLVGLAAVALYWVIKKLVEYVQRRRATLEPKGALLRGPALGRPSGRVGTIAEGPTIASPLGRTQGVAYGIVLERRRWFRGQVMLRDAASAGFEVVLDDGERLRVPAGTIVLDMSSAPWVEPEPGRHLGYVGRIDPLRCDLDHDPLRFTDARERVLVPGVRVEIRGPVQPVPDAEAPARGYREAPGTILHPVGVPRIALVHD